MKDIFSEDIKLIADSDINWSKLKNKTVLVAGANGYVPQYFVHGFIKRNDLYGDNITVIALCRNEKKAEQRFEKYYGRRDFRLILQDVVEPLDYAGKIDYIIDAACQADQKSRYDNVVASFEASVTGCKNMLELARKNRASFLFISSIDIYGKNSSGERLKEDSYGALDPLNIRNVYSCSKKAAENLCCCYSYMGVDCKIVRPSQIMGGGIALDDGRLHIDFISQILKNNNIVLKGDGTPRRTFMYVTDAISAMLTVMLEGETGNAYNVCTEKCEASVLELAQLMAGNAKGRNVEITYNMETRKNDPAVTQVVSVVLGDSSKLRNLGWDSKISLEEACRRMMTYYGIDV